jgi:quercetin dioxygenase-like cupin family protein
MLSCAEFSSQTRENFMKSVLYVTMAVLVTFAASGWGQEAKGKAHAVKADMPEAVFKNYKDLKWDKILSDLGENSPEICILHVDPKTKATKLLIRCPKAIHIRKHWHSANETHTMVLGTAEFACDGKRVEQRPGSFNFLPAKMVHEAWPSAGSVVFITVDGAWDINWVDGAPTAADLIQ